MSRSGVRAVHAGSSLAALAIVSMFFIGTVGALLAGDPAAIRTVKGAIFSALFALVPVMAAAGATGRKLAGKSSSPIVQRKLRRMRLTTINGALVLAPCVVMLHRMAAAGDTGAVFTAVQTLELVAGAVNVTLLALNARDGFAMHRRPSSASAGSAFVRMS